MRRTMRWALNGPMINKRTQMGAFWPTKIQLWREMADKSVGRKKANDSLDRLCKSSFTDAPFSNGPVPYGKYRYPSPRRSDHILVRPTPLFRAETGDLRRLRQGVQKMLVLRAYWADSVANNKMQYKGSNLCKNSVLSSLLAPLRRFRHVSTMILSAALPAQRLVRLSQMPLVEASSQAPLSVALLARCVTKSRASAAKTNTPFWNSRGSQNTLNRRSGTSLSGGFAFLRGQ